LLIIINIKKMKNKKLDYFLKMINDKFFFQTTKEPFINYIREMRDIRFSENQVNEVFENFLKDIFAIIEARDYHRDIFYNL